MKLILVIASALGLCLTSHIREHPSHQIRNEEYSHQSRWEEEPSHEAVNYDRLRGHAEEEPSH